MLQAGLTRILARPREDRDVHVLHVVRTLGPGGMERNMVRVAADGTRRGARHSVLLLHEQTDIVPLPPEVTLVRAVAKPRDPRMPLLVAARIRALAPTVIHVRNFGAWTDVVLARSAVAPFVPLVWSYHGMEKASLGERERVRYRGLAALSSRIFAVSEAARALIVDQLRLSKGEVGVIANGVDVERFSPGPSRARGGRFVIGAVGRLFEIKQFPLLLRAVRRLLDDGHDVELRLAGDGPDEEPLRALGRELALGDRLIMPGRIEDVPTFLRGLDAFVLSSDNEANPNALLEAMATGLACVSTAVGGAREVLDEGRAGLLVPVRDEVRLAGAIASLVKDDLLRRAYGARARAHAVERYGHARMLDAYARLYRDPRGALLG